MLKDWRTCAVLWFMRTLRRRPAALASRTLLHVIPMRRTGIGCHRLAIGGGALR